MRRKTVRMAGTGLIAVLVVFIAGAIYYILTAGGESLPVAGQAPDFTATNLDDRTVKMSDLNGKIRLVTWFYTHCPDECPLTASYMTQIQNQLKQEGLFGKKVVFISISIDPKGDTRAAMQEFAREHSADLGGWYFLQPGKDTVKLMQEWGIQAKPGQGAAQLEHVIRTDLVDSHGNIRKSYNTAELPVQEILGDIHGLLTRSSWS